MSNKQTAIVTSTFTGAGMDLQVRFVVEGDSGVPYMADLAAAKAGTLTARTDDDTGVVTLGSGHGILSSDEVDLYWGDVTYRSGMIATVSGPLVTVNGGAGTILPSTSTPVTLVKRKLLSPVVINGDNLRAMGFIFDAPKLTSTARMVIEFFDASDVSIYKLHLANNVIAKFGAGDNNVFEGEIVTYVKVSQSDANYPGLLKMPVLQNLS